MTQSTPTEAWVKVTETTAMGETWWNVVFADAPKDYDERHVLASFTKGRAHAELFAEALNSPGSQRERSAPDESREILMARLNHEALISDKRAQERDNAEKGYQLMLKAWDEAKAEAASLGKELDAKKKEWLQLANDSVGFVRERDEAQAQLASLRAENDALRASLDETITTLELIAGPVEFYCEIGERNKQSAAQATLAKLRGEAKEGKE